jgi:hypothetical protein
MVHNAHPNPWQLNMQEAPESRHVSGFHISCRKNPTRVFSAVFRVEKISEKSRGSEAFFTWYTLC